MLGKFILISIIIAAMTIPARAASPGGRSQKPGALTLRPFGGGGSCPRRYYRTRFITMVVDHE